MTRLPALAAELVARKVDVIVALEPPAVLAAMHATRTIPIVMRSTVDPVLSGWVASLSRPGRNITGMSSVSAELRGKRIELLRELIPNLERILLLWNPDDPSSQAQLREIADDNQRMRLETSAHAVRTMGEIEESMSTLPAKPASGVDDRARSTVRQPRPGDRRNRIAAQIAQCIRRARLCRGRRLAVLRGQPDPFVRTGRLLCGENPKELIPPICRWSKRAGSS